MGTVSGHLGKYATTRGSGAATIGSSEVISSFAFTTSTTEAKLEDSGATDITVSPGQVLYMHADEAMRVLVNGTATASVGVYIPAGQSREIECHEGGLVSVIDVA